MFADKDIVEMLKTKFIAVAIDQAYQRRQKDNEGEFYRKIAGQGPRKDFQGTTQGLYIAEASGKLLTFTNNRSADRLKPALRAALAKARPEKTENIEAGKEDPRWNVKPPAGGLVVRVRAKVLGGYEPTEDYWKQIFQKGLSRDNLWISAAEHKDLVAGKFSPSLRQRIARFHLVDNTRGEPPMWAESEVQKIQMTIKDGKIQGMASLKAKSADRSFDATLLGLLEAKDGKVTRFDVVVKGNFQGEGPFTRGAPKGRFPLAISFELSDGTDVADRIPPQASRGWLQGYIR